MKRNCAKTWKELQALFPTRSPFHNNYEEIPIYPLHTFVQKKKKKNRLPVLSKLLLA